MKWGLVCKPKVKKSIDLAKKIQKYLEEHGEVLPEKKIAGEIKQKGYSLEELNKKTDIVVAVGGDGTILKTCSVVEKPVFAINSGGMGFLSEVESKYALDSLERVIAGDYNVEERSKLKTTLDGKRLPDAVNEVTVQTARIAKIMYFQISVDGELLETMGADGIIISTPTGSTSYALSVGGPIMDPAVNAILIAPLAPFRLSARPWVIPFDKKININVLPKSKETNLVIDGSNLLPVTSNNKIVVTGSEKKARFIRFGESFYQMVRLKLVR